MISDIVYLHRWIFIAFFFVRSFVAECCESRKRHFTYDTTVAWSSGSKVTEGHRLCIDICFLSQCVCGWSEKKGNHLSLLPNPVPICLQCLFSSLFLFSLFRYVVVTATGLVKAFFFFISYLDNIVSSWVDKEKRRYRTWRDITDKNHLCPAIWYATKYFNERERGKKTKMNQWRGAVKFDTDSLSPCYANKIDRERRS